MARREQVEIKSRSEILTMREAGLVVARTIERVQTAVRPGISTAELDEVAEASIRGEGATPNFKGYHGFPATICTSVNEEIVHGIPTRRRVLRDGDIISIDCGAIVDGWHGDAATTVAVGSVDPGYLELMRVCEQSLWAGLAAAQLGGRLTDISHAVETTVRPAGFGIVDSYGGHGIGTAMHQPPHLLNHGRPGRGQKLVPGLVLAVEPMITSGSPETQVLDDDWTVITVDGSRAAHYEHTVAITADGPWVLTAPDGGVERLASLGVRAGQPVQPSSAA